MTGSFSKRKYAGPTVQELRKVDQDPAKVPPHKKPRKYRLTVSYVRTTTETVQKDFHTKADMQAFRAGVEREIAKEKAAKPRGASRYWGTWYLSGNHYKMDGVKRSEFKTGPDFTEEMLQP